jgi:bacteriocin-like protein
MEKLSDFEMENINGGRLKSVSDWLLLGGGVAFCFACPEIAVPATVIIAVFS